MLIFNQATGLFYDNKVTLNGELCRQKANFINPNMVEEYRLEPKIIPRQVFTIKGVHFSCSKEIGLLWKGNDSKVRDVRCFLLPVPTPITTQTLVLGLNFITEHGHRLLDEALDTTAQSEIVGSYLYRIGAYFLSRLGEEYEGGAEY